MGLSVIAAGTAAVLSGDPSRPQVDRTRSAGVQEVAGVHREAPSDPWMPRPAGKPAGTIEHCGSWVRDGFVSVQVNVDANGCNTVGDAANEPSIAIDSTDPNNIVIGWRQFDTVLSNFRQAGWGYSHDAGRTWTFPGVLEPGVFSSDPVLGADSDGNLYYYSLQPDRGPGEWACYLYRSFDGGVTWAEQAYGYGGDKAWFAIDTTTGPGRGNFYAAWDHWGCCGYGIFTRSTDGGASFMPPIGLPGVPEWGTVTVGPNGEVYISGLTAKVLKSLNAQDPKAIPAFQYFDEVDLGGTTRGWAGPNPGGLLGQSWIACDHSTGTFRGNVYLLASVQPFEGDDPLDVMFIRSMSAGTGWSLPIRLNDDAVGNGAWQWFGTLSVAPNGRIDVVWNDTRNDPTAQVSELYYSFSIDAGRTWARNLAVSLPFNHHLGYPQQYKLGDYYHMISDEYGASLAYAATFNGEQDVYYLRLAPDCNDSGTPDFEDLSAGKSLDTNANWIPDECEPDIDADGLYDYDDPDIDGDEVLNPIDVCPFAPVGLPTYRDGGTLRLGRPLGDVASLGGLGPDCTVNLADYQFLYDFRCFTTSGPGTTSPNRVCSTVVDFDGDGDIDLKDFAGFQRAFGRIGR